MPDDILSSRSEQRPPLLDARDRPPKPAWRLPRPGRGARIAGAVLFAAAVVGGIANLRTTTPPAPAPVPQPVHIRLAPIDIPYYPPPPRQVIPSPHAVPHTTLVGGSLPASRSGPNEVTAFAAMGAVLDHYCAHRGGGGAQSLRPLEGYRHVVALVNPPWEPEIDIELWWTGTSYRWQAQSGPLAACG